VGFRQQICPDLLVGGDRVTRQTAGAVDFAGMEPKQMSTGVGDDVRHTLREDDAVG
jgi:hypothetical protein